MDASIRVSITLDNGSVAIMSFITHGRGSVLPNGAAWSDEPGYWKREPTDANIFDEVCRAFSNPDGPQPVRTRVIQESDIPADRAFRDALEDDGKVLRHNLTKARDIHLARLRRKRVLLLEQLDRDWSRANGQGRTSEAAEIESKRQRLRDMTKDLAPAIAAAKNTDELKAVELPV